MLSTCVLLSTLAAAADIREDLWRAHVVSEAEAVVRQAMGLHPMGSDTATMYVPKVPLALPATTPPRIVDAGAVIAGRDSTYAVSREVWEHYVAEPRRLRHLGHATPVKEHGRINGWRLGGIKHGSLGHTMGLRSGDVVLQLNGHRAGSLPSLLRIRRELRRAREVTVLLERGDVTMRVHVVIR